MGLCSGARCVGREHPKTTEGSFSFQDIMQLIEHLVDWFSTEEMELFWVHSWLIWNLLGFMP